ncbi:MAG: glutamyl-tRNA reductase [Alphaproteobacteria bacterium]|nr:glutamyl-tRNA reductase [Alphaproteobacteria bacterium]
MSAGETLRYLVVGATHRTAPLELRERMAEGADGTPLTEQIAGLELGQVAVMVTCDRVELIAAVADPEGAAAVAMGLLAARAGLARDRAAPALRWLADDAAVRHVFAIASGLESLVLGEPEVLGQVHEAEREARRQGRFGPELDALCQATYRAAKRARSETAIGEGPVSLAASAVAVALDIHGSLATVAALVIGAADIAELIAGKLREAGLGRLAVTHWRERQAAETARKLGANILPIADLEAGLAGADIVLAGAGTGRYMVTRDALARAIRARRRRPMFVIDVSLPPDVEPGVDGIDGIFRYDLADLERVARIGQGERVAAATAAWTIVDESVAAFLRDRVEREAVPAIRTLRAAFESTRDRVLADRPDADVAEATRLLVNRLLHGPSEALRRAAAEGTEGRDLEAMLERLFGRRGDERKQ